MLLAFLDRIRRRKTWSITGSVALSPDSNINNATSATEVDLFGLPAQLSEDARETSGVGLSVNLNGGYEGRISPDLRFRTSAGLSTRTYRESQFNERIVNLRAGPRFLFERFDLRPELTTRVRDLGGDLYSRSAGLELSGNWLIAPSWRMNAAVGGERVSYETFLGDGHTFSAELGARPRPRTGDAGACGHLPSAARIWMTTPIRGGSTSSGCPPPGSFPGGFVVGGGPLYRWREYGAPLPAFSSEVRRDRTLGARITVSNRRIDWIGFSPQITLRHERRDSNLDLYDYKRTVGEFSLIRTF